MYVYLSRVSVQLRHLALRLIITVIRFAIVATFEAILLVNYIIQIDLSLLNELALTRHLYLLALAITDWQF